MMSCNRRHPRQYSAHFHSAALVQEAGYVQCLVCGAVLAAIKITSPMLLLHRLVGGAEERRVSCGTEARKEIPFYVQNTV